MTVTADKLHPKARAIVDQIAKAAPPLASLTPEQARALPLPLDPAPEPVGTLVTLGIPGPAGLMRVRIYRPRTAPLGALVYYHGGGWVVGSLDGADAMCRALTNGATCTVVSVDYRLAPETKFPGPVEDAYAALRWSSTAEREIGVSADRIAVGGASAGANLAAAAALMARDRGGPGVTFQLLAVPVVDLARSAASFAEFADGYGLTRTDMEWFARHYLRTEADAEHPYASVVRADLRGMPPAFIATAECDPLRDDGERYGERLRSASVDARITRYPGMHHGFMGYPRELEEARRALDDMSAALRAAFAQMGGSRSSSSRTSRT